MFLFCAVYITHKIMSYPTDQEDPFEGHYYDDQHDYANEWQHDARQSRTYYDDDDDTWSSHDNPYDTQRSRPEPHIEIRRPCVNSDSEQVCSVSVVIEKCTLYHHQKFTALCFISYFLNTF